MDRNENGISELTLARSKTEGENRSHVTLVCDGRPVMINKIPVRRFFTLT